MSTKWLASLAEKIKKDPNGTSEEYSIPMVLLVPLAMLKLSWLAIFICAFALPVVAAVAKGFYKFHEKKWRIDLESRGVVWDSRHWMLWCAKWLVSSCVAGTIGMTSLVFVK